MANIQDIVNHLAKLLRIQVIEALIKEDCFKFNAPLPSEEELDYRKVAINKLPCCTKMLKKLFQDAHEMQEARGMFPRPVCVADLEWCLDHRNIGLLQRGVRQDWLPAKEDNDLQQLSAFVQLDAIYRKLKKALPPIDEIAIQNEATRNYQQHRNQLVKGACMNSFDIYSVEYQPKRIFFTREVRKALKKAFADAIVGAFAITLLVASCMDLDKLLEQLL